MKTTNFLIGKMVSVLNFVISDLHGRYDRYISMLDRIKFSKSDILYVLGDSIDGQDGSEPIKLIQDMIKRKNVINLQGNHELWALPLIRPLKKILDFYEYGGILAYRNYRFKKSYFRLDDWLTVGGMPTLEGLVNLPQNERVQIIDYIESWGFYKDILIDCKNRYILSHAGLYEPDTLLEELPYISGEEWTFSMDLDYNSLYFPIEENIYLITGHNPTENINSEYRGKIYRNKNHIVVDTGTIFGRETGCLCLETGEEFYV